MGVFDATCFKYSCLGKTVGVVACIVLFVGGIMTMISTSSLCWAVGLYMILCSMVVGILELPLVFQFIECFKVPAAKLKNVQPWHRAVFYGGLAVFCFFCPGASSILSAILLLMVSFLYGMEALGPRGGGAGPSPSRRSRSTSNGDVEEGQELMIQEDSGSSDEFTAMESPTDIANAYPWDKFMDKADGGAVPAEDGGEDNTKTKKKDKKKKDKKQKKTGSRDLEAGLLPPANPLSGDVPDELVGADGYPSNPFV